MDAAAVKENIAGTAHLTAWMRTLARASCGQDAANADYLAARFLLPMQRLTLRAPRASRWLVERVMPGAMGYFNARTRYFDDVLRHEATRGIDQLVLLGAGFDTRPVRFARELGTARVFEVDMPQVLHLRRLQLQTLQSSHCVPVPIDLARDNLASELCKHGFEITGKRTLFLWEGVTYYLYPSAVDEVLADIGALSSPGSSLVFDYVTLAFHAGDHSGYGAKNLAGGWKQLGNVNRSGVADAALLLRPHGLRVREELGAQELSLRYLTNLPGGALRPWEPLRIAHAERV
jgi:methyltransferase (TIGR00027 family)